MTHHDAQYGFLVTLIFLCSHSHNKNKFDFCCERNASMKWCNTMFRGAVLTELNMGSSQIDAGVRREEVEIFWGNETMPLDLISPKNYHMSSVCVWNERSVCGWRFTIGTNVDFMLLFLSGTKLRSNMKSTVTLHNFVVQRVLWFVDWSNNLPPAYSAYLAFESSRSDGCCRRFIRFIFIQNHDCTLRIAWK